MAVDEDTIEGYFALRRRIQKTRKRIRERERKFQSQNYFTRIGERYGEMAAIAFDLEREVVNYVTATQEAKKHLSELEFKEKHFQRFWETLGEGEQDYLLSRYKENEPTLNARLDALIAEEVGEIEEACSYFFKKKEPLSINFNPLEEDDFEQSFQKMIEILGV